MKIIKNKLSIIIGTILLSTIAAINIDALYENNVLANTFFSTIEAYANSSEGGISGAHYRTITASCKNASFSNWLNRCCKGSTTNCIHESCSGPVLQDCSERGYLPVYL